MNVKILTPNISAVELSTAKSLRRILVIGRISLLEEGVIHLLSARQGVEVYHTDDSNPSGLALKATQICPNVIVLCHIGPALVNNLVDRLDCIPTPADRIMINIDLGKTELHIYQYHRWVSAALPAFFSLAYGEKVEVLLESGLST